MEHLNSELSGYLKLIAPHSRDLDFFDAHFQELGFEQAYKESVLIRGLIEHHMIEPSDTYRKKERTYGGEATLADGSCVTTPKRTDSVSYPTGFVLTSDGESYFREIRIEAAVKACAAILTAALGGLLAVLFERLL